MRNPFNPKHPVDPEFFVNRKEIIESFKKSFSRSAETMPPKPDNIAVLGDWGIGKTSVLRKLEAIATDELTDAKAFTAFIELTPESCSNFQNFMIRVRDEIERSFKVVDLPLLGKLKRDIIPKWRIKSIELGVSLERAPLQERSPITAFENTLKDLWEAIQPLGINIVLLMLDDLHYLAEKHPDGLYDIRGVFQKLAMDGCNYYLAVAAKESLFYMAKEFAEPFTRFFDRFELNPFDYEETRRAVNQPLKLVKSPMKVEEKVIKKLYSLTQGHPYFIHFIMQDLVDYKERGNINIKFFGEVYPKIAKHLAREKFASDLKFASDAEQKVLFAMAASSNDIIKTSEIKTPGARRILKTLTEEKELVRRKRRGEYSLYHPLFKEYLKRMKKAE